MATGLKPRKNLRAFHKTSRNAWLRTSEHRDSWRQCCGNKSIRDAQPLFRILVLEELPGRHRSESLEPGKGTAR